MRGSGALAGEVADLAGVPLGSPSPEKAPPRRPLSTIHGRQLEPATIPFESPAGHIEMYDGSRWMSDFKQPSQDIWPGPGYRAAKPAYAIYRP